MSISQNFMGSISDLRNPNCCLTSTQAGDAPRRTSSLKLVAAEVAFVAMVIFAVAETLVNAARMTYYHYSGNSERDNEMGDRILSSSFCAGWALANVFLNFLHASSNLPRTEGSARIYYQGHYPTPITQTLITADICPRHGHQQ